MPRASLRNGLDHDVYQVLRKLEDQNGTTFKTITQVYDAIQRSNSHVRRQKKRPLEDAIERVLQLREEENQDSEDSEAEIDDSHAETKDDRFLLNRQLTKHWHTDKAPEASEKENRATKKRRLEKDAEDRLDEVSGSDALKLASLQTNGLSKQDASITTSQKMPSLKRVPKTPRFQVEHLAEPELLGGMGEIHDQLLLQMRTILKEPNDWIEESWQRVSGLIISGPAGVGKKSLVRSLAAKLEVPIILLAPCLADPERIEKSLGEAIDEALRLAPSIIFIKDIDRYASRSGSNGHSDYHGRVVDLLERHMLRLRQELKAQPERYVLAMATTSNVTDISPELTKCGLFGRTVQMRVPDLEAREDIFKVITKGTGRADDINYTELARMTHGFVGADIQDVILVAQERAALRRAQARHALQIQVDTAMADAESTQAPTALESSDTVTFEDFCVAIKDFVPSLRKEGFTVIPNVSWDQVGALNKAREQLQMSIVGPIKNPLLYESWGITQPAGVLLWGPPGCGKTLVAQAIANEAQASFILINGPELLNKYVGESERAVREVFQRARSSTPCILFFDEMDSLVPRRDGASSNAGVRIVNTLLTELDGVQDRSGIYVIGTTNRPDMIDEAMLRPGRLSERIFIDLPTKDERVDILRAIFKSKHPQATEVELARLEAVARDPRCEGYSGADLGGLHTKAAEHGLKQSLLRGKNIPEIDEQDWEVALATTKKSVQNPSMYREADAGI